jgi:hypothetical protein
MVRVRWQMFLRDNLRAITTLTCRFKDLSNIEVVSSVVASLPNLDRLVVDCPSESWHVTSLLPGAVLAFMMRSRSDRYNWVLLEQMHLVTVNGHTPPDNGMYGTLRWNKEFRSRIVEQVVRERSLLCTSLHVQSISPPLDPSATWTLVVHDPFEITWLSLGRPDFGGRCGTAIMSALHLPALTVLEIRDNSRLTTNDLFGFLSRHPTIRSLRLEHRALTRESLEDLKQSPHRWPLPNVTSLSGPVPYILTIVNVNDCDTVHRLRKICLGVRRRSNHDSRRFIHTLRRFFLFNDDRDEKFSFKLLDEVLHKLHDINPAIALSMVFPTSFVAIKWWRKWKFEELLTEFENGSEADYHVFLITN